MPFTFEIDGPIDAAILADAVNDVAARHESLRTTLRYQGGLRQHVSEPVRQLVTLVDVSAEQDPDGAARQQAIALTLQPFRLDAGPLWNATLIRTDPAGNRHVMVWVASHAVVDGWSIGVFLDELALAYDRRAVGDLTPWEPPAAQFADFAAWQRKESETGQFDEATDYWRSQLQGSTPLAFPAGGIPSGQGATRRFPLHSALISAVAAVARGRQATHFVVFLAAYHILLAGLSGGGDVCVGTVVSGRGRPAFERVIGSCINTVVIRLRADLLGGDPSGIAVIDQIRESVLEALDQQDLPFGKLVEVLAPERLAAANPVCRTVFTYGATPMAAAARLGSASVRAVGIPTGPSASTTSWPSSRTAPAGPGGLSTTRACCRRTRRRPSARSMKRYCAASQPPRTSRCHRTRNSSALPARRRPG